MWSQGRGGGAGTGAVPGSGVEEALRGVRRQKTHLYNLVTQRLPSYAW